MKKLLRLRDIFYLTIGGVLDFIEEVKDPLGIQAGACKNLYGWVPERYKKHNFYNMVWKSLKTGDIEKIVKNDGVYLRLTSKGKERLKRDFPLVKFQKRKWDGKWRLVFFDISESSRRIRDLLRRKLKELGFAMIQRSVYITPHDIVKDFREFVESKGLGDKVYLLESKNFLAGDPKELANKIWKLDKFNKKYKELFVEIEKLRALQKVYDRNKKAMVEERVSEVRNRYLYLALKDPYLPKQLLPADWMGEQIREEIKKLGITFSL